MTGPEKLAVSLALVGEEVHGEQVGQLPQNEILELGRLGKIGVITHDAITDLRRADGEGGDCRPEPGQ